MSSITDRSAERGQTLVIFVLGITVLLGIAALAFDVGQNFLDRRGEQNAADAGALAGARYIVESTCLANPSLANCSDAVNEAMRVANQNGYGAGPTAAYNGIAAANGTTVVVKVPPGPESAFSGQHGYIEVEINRTRPSLFAGVLGAANQQTGVLATASNLTGVALNYAMLSLDPNSCAAAKFAGNGTVTVSGNIQVNSTCSSDAFDAVGNTEVSVTSEGGLIGVVGGAKCNGSAICYPPPTEGVQSVPDPLLSLAAPSVPSLPAKPSELVGSAAIPAGCPGGSSAATATAPNTCTFNSSYAGTTWVLSPGYYPGGISLQSGTFFLLPGLYYLGGGGFNNNGTGASVYTVSAGWNQVTPPTTCTASSFADCGGVMFYNTDDPSATSGGSSVTDLGQIKLNGSGPTVQLYPIQNAGPYTGIVIFQDRTLTYQGSGGDVSLNGSGSNLTVDGAIYVPSGLVSVNGTGDLGSVQVIAYDFTITGGGTLNIDYNAGDYPQLHAVGLVE